MDDVDESHSIYFMSALPRMKSATLVRSKDTIPKCAKLKDKKPRELRKTYRKSNASVYHTCEEQEFENSASSEETMSYAEQVTTVEEVHQIGSKAEFPSIKKNGMTFECRTTLNLQ